MQKLELKRCPLCGQPLNGTVENEELLSDVHKLKEQGVLTQTLFVAVKITQSMSENNPAWMRDLLKEQDKDLKESFDKRLIQEIRPVLQAIMELKGSPQRLGKLQELEIAKRLSSLKTGKDCFSTAKSLKGGEDVLCIVKDDETVLGKIVIESKRTKRWSEEFLSQVKEYMEKEGTEFGILATTTLPDDALNFTAWRDGVLVVKLDYVETAYVFMRELLRTKTQLKIEYDGKIAQLEVKDQILQELKDSVTNGELDKIISRVNELSLAIDDSAVKLEQYIKRHIKEIKTSSKKIRDMTSLLVNDYIEKIRTQLSA